MLALNRGIKNFWAAATGEVATPSYLLFFVTARCDCRCEHCFYWRSTNRVPDELTLAEIEKIAATCGDLIQLTLTGGDSAYRDDLPEIVRAFVTRNRVQNVTVATNGYRTDAVLAHVTRILAFLPEATGLTLDTSLDGLAEEHDTIRNRPGIFDAVVKTIRGLKTIQKDNRKLNICLNVTVSAFNHLKLRPLYDFMVTDLRPDILNALFIRGEPRNPQAKNIALSRYREICRWIKEDTAQGKIRGYNFFTDALHAKDFILRDLIIKTARTNRFQYPCTAARLTGVIYPQGDVMACELRPLLLGNLRQENYDLRRIWSSARARIARRRIAYEKCFCVHQCFLSNNIVSNPNLLLRLVMETARLKSRRINRRLGPRRRP